MGPPQLEGRLPHLPVRASGRIAAWLSGGGQTVLQLLPLNEMAAGQQSPYSATSAMAIDPIFIQVPALLDFSALGGELSLDEADRQRLDAVRRGSQDTNNRADLGAGAYNAMMLTLFCAATWGQSNGKRRN